MSTPTTGPTPRGDDARPPRRPLWWRIGRAALVLLALAFIAAVVAFDVFKVGSVALATPPKVDRVISVPQNRKPGWDDKGIDWFHYATQGTKILPYEWFVSLRQPEIGILHTPGKVVDPDYIRRFGFLPGEKHQYLNPDGLPIGFAIDEHFVDPRLPLKDQKEVKVVGLTCAGCHTGMITHKTNDGKLVGVRIEGGSAMINVRVFQEAIGRALFFTKIFPMRFNAFAADVLARQKRPDDVENRENLRAQLDAVIAEGMKADATAKRLGLFEVEHGFSRTDALALIGNRVFGNIDDANLASADAPVNFPSIWDTAWYDWVQYNGSIQMPMVRNIGEALGVGAIVNLNPYIDTPMFTSTVHVENLHKIETYLGGDTPFSGLRSPKWADAGLPPVDAVKAEKGRALYARYCLRCHMPPPEELEKEFKAENFTHWTKPGKAPFDRRFLKMPMLDIKLIGTDPSQALNLYRRIASVGPNTLSAVKGLQTVTEEIRYHNYKKKGLLENDDARAEWDRWRNHVAPEQKDLRDRLHAERDDEVVFAFLKYKANPLNGVWATPPYFHNSSVPNLYQVLVPVKDRDKTFYLGSTELDARRVGFLTTEFPGASILDTTKPGNRNTGHEFRDLTLAELESNRFGERTVGKADDERWAKILGGDMTAEQYRRLPTAERRDHVRRMTLKLLIQSEQGKRLGSVTGVVGPELLDEERWELVEYLKTL